MKRRERNLQDVLKSQGVRNDDPYRERSIRDADRKATFYADRDDWDHVIDAAGQFIGRVL